MSVVINILGYVMYADGLLLISVSGLQAVLIIYDNFVQKHSRS